MAMQRVLHREHAGGASFGGIHKSAKKRETTMNPCRNPVSKGVARSLAATACIAAAMLLAMPLQAEDKYWTGAIDANWFRYSTKNWTNSVGTAVNFNQGDSVYFDGVSTRRDVEIGEDVQPSNIVFDIENDMSVTNRGGQITSAVRFEKRGSGTLTLLAKYSGQINTSTNEVHVYGGTLKTVGGANAHGMLGYPTLGFKVFIHDGGTLNVRDRNTIGDGNSKTEFTVYTNGVFSFETDPDPDIININMFGSLHLNGGTLILPQKSHSSGTLRVKDVFSFNGPTPYLFSTNQTGFYSGSHRHCFQIYTNTEIRVADITGDDGADVTFENHLVERKGTGYRCGFRKTGPGKLVLAADKSRMPANDSEVMWPTGPITVEEGVLDYAAPQQFAIADSDAITVKSNSTLVVTGKMFADLDNNGLSTNIFPRPLIVEEGGTVLFRDLAAARHHAFGDLSITDFSKFDVTGLAGDVSCGVLSLLGKVTLGGTNAWNLSCDTFPAAMANSGYNYTSNDWTKILMRRAETPTEFCVPDVTGDTNIDFIVGCVLSNQRDMKGRYWAPSRFIKTGAGTMLLANSYNDFKGGLEVKEGMVILGLPTGHNADTSGNPAHSYMGDLSADTGYPIVVSGTGTLWVPNRNMFSIVGRTAITNNPATSAKWQYSHLIIRDGGHLRITQHEYFDRLEFSNGGRLSGYGQNTGWGIFSIVREIKVSGNAPFSDGGDADEPANKLNWMETNAILVNGYPETVFDVADTTGDSRDDATFYRPLAITYAYKAARIANPPTCGEWKFGFRKTGTGTMRLVARQTPQGRTATSSGNNVWPLNGTITVAEGELKVDCDHSALENVAVSAGAYVSGTGKVNSVTLADGAGLRAVANAAVPLTVNGTFTFGATGRIELSNPGSIDRRDVKVVLAKFNGPVAGAENLANWTVSFNGTDYPADTWRCEVCGDKLIVGFQRGLMLKLR